MQITFQSNSFVLATPQEQNIVRMPVHILSHPTNEAIVLLSGVAAPHAEAQAFHIAWRAVSNITAADRFSFITMLQQLSLQSTEPQTADVVVNNSETTIINPVMKETEIKEVTITKTKKLLPAWLLFFLWFMIATAVLYLALYATIYIRILYLMPWNQ